MKIENISVKIRILRTSLSLLNRSVKTAKDDAEYNRCYRMIKNKESKLENLKKMHPEYFI